MEESKTSVDNLHELLSEDFKDTKNCTLHIIYGSNIDDLTKNEVLDFYNNSFKNTNIKKIIFYYSVPELDSKQSSYVEGIAEDIKIELCKVYGIIGMLGDFSNIKGLDYGINISEQYIDDSKGFNKINLIFHFASELDKNGVSIEFQPYLKSNQRESNNLYLLYDDFNKKIGYIVDRNLSESTIRMDEENFNNVYMLFNNQVISRISGLEKFDKDELFGINSDIKDDLDIDTSNMDKFLN